MANLFSSEPDWWYASSASSQQTDFTAAGVLAVIQASRLSFPVAPQAFVLSKDVLAKFRRAEQGETFDRMFGIPFWECHDADEARKVAFDLRLKGYRVTVCGFPELEG